MNFKNGRVFALSFLFLSVGFWSVSTHTVFAAVTFSAAVDYAISGTGSYPPITGDFNGDGKIDIAVPNYDANTVSILLGVGNGTFSAAVDRAAPGGPDGITTGDFNGDGKADLAVANYDTSTVSIWMGVGDGTFTTTMSYVGSGPEGIVAGDYNADGEIDLAYVNYDTSTVSIRLGAGDGTFGTATSYSVGTNPSDVTIGDFNGDGKLDLVVTNAASTVSVLLGVGNGTFNTSVPYTVGTSPHEAHVGDFNGDGISDLAVPNFATSNLSILIGVGNGTFAAAVNYAAGLNPFAISLGDFDANGTTDLVVVNRDNKAAILLGVGNGTFGAKTDYTPGTVPYKVITGDFNADGKTDLAVINDPIGSVSIMLNSTATSAPTAILPVVSQYTASLVTATSTIADAGLNKTNLFVEYSTNNVTWHNATLSSGSENGEGNGVTLSTNHIIGIDTNNDGSVLLTFAWNAATDIPNTEDSTVWLRVTPNNGTATGTTMYSSTFAVDTKAPTAPGSLTVGTLGTTTAQLTFGAQATDANFSQYKIFYKLGASGVTTADTAWTTANDANLGFVNYNAAAASTLTGLSVNTQYVANIWAYDTFGQNTGASTERTFYTLAAVPSTPTVSALSTNSINVVIAQNSNPSTVTYSLCTTTNGTSCDASGYVQANGLLGGSAVYQSYATWGGVSGTTVTGLLAGTNYRFLVQAKNSSDVVTSYSTASAIATTFGGPGGGGWSSFVTDTPNLPLAVAINSGATSTTSRVVLLNLTAGSNVIGMALSRTSDFTNISQEPYQYTRIWDLCQPTQTVCAPGTYSVYVKYFTFTGASSVPIQAMITYAPFVVFALPGQNLLTTSSTLPIVQTTSTPPELPLFELPIINIISPGPVLLPVSPMILLPKFLRNLSLGSRGTDVKSLQIFLNRNGFVVAKTGAGSPGNETAYFGSATRATLVKYQRAFLKEILGPKAILSQANGLFGPLTRAYVNQLLASFR